MFHTKGSVTKVNEYVIVRDLGQGSSAEVKLCRLVMPPDRTSTDQRETRTSEGFADGERTGGDGNDVGGTDGEGEVPRRRRRRPRNSGAENHGARRGRRDEDEQEEEGGDDDSDLYVRDGA